jgi:hypothetical protein
MKRLVLFTVLLFSIGSFHQTVAQNFARKYVPAVRKFYAFTGMDKIDKHIYYGVLIWENLEKVKLIPVVGIKFFATEKTGVYFALQILSDGDQVGFALGEECIKSKRREGEKITVVNEIDFEQPYIFRKVADGWEAEGYTETTEINKLFESLNEFFFHKMLLEKKDQPPSQFTKTELEMGKAFTIIPPKSWRWVKSEAYKNQWPKTLPDQVKIAKE